MRVLHIYIGIYIYALSIFFVFIRKKFFVLIETMMLYIINVKKAVITNLSLLQPLYIVEIKLSVR